MELEKLQGFVLLIVLVGMLIGIGVLVTDKFGGTTFYSRTGHNDTITAPANNTRIALDYGNITSVTKLSNGTFQDTLDSACYEVFTTNGSFAYYNYTAVCNTYGANLNLIYNYKQYATETRSAMASVTSEISGIATNWLGLIVTVSILAIILFLVMRSFSGGMQRK